MESNFESGCSAAESSFDPMFSGLSIHSVLSLNPSVLADYSATTGLLNYGFITHDSQPSLNPGRFTEGSTIIQDQILDAKEKKPMVPEREPYLSHELATSALLSQQPFDFFSKSPTDFYDSGTFHRLPELHAMERHGPESFTQNNKRDWFDSLSPAPTLIAHHNMNIHSANNLCAVIASHSKKQFSSSSLDSPVGGKAPSATVIPQSNLARKRRQKLSDKTRCLQKLIPWDKKMDQATLFEEAFKYVKFLHAQLYAPQSMPSDSPFPATQCDLKSSFKNVSGLGDLERLNWNQVLQVLVNSPVAQTMLCSQGFCVFSMEKLTLLKHVSERRFLLQQVVMFGNANPSPKPAIN